MKIILLVFAILLAGVLGYFSLPKFPARPASAAQDHAAGQPIADMEELDPASLAPNQLPRHVTLVEKVEVSHSSSGLVLSFEKGTVVNLLRINHTNAIIQPSGTTYQIDVPVKDTDLMTRLRSKPLPPPVFPAPDVGGVTAPPTAAAPARKSEPVAAPAPEPAAVPEPVAATPTPAPESAVAPAPEPDPISTPAPTITPAAIPTPPADAPPTAPTNVVVIMKESIRDRQIKEFRFDQVLSWKAGETETVGGQVFQTGLIAYKAQTIFGVKNIQAKAFIQNGKVVRWVWAQSGKEIK